MTSYEWFVFFLCLFIFVSLVLFLGVLIYLNYKHSKRIIEGGLDDELIIKEKQKEKEKKKSKFFTILGKAISYVVTFIVGAFFIFSMSVRLMEDMTPNGMSTMQVVVSDSMSYKHEKNTYLEENNLNDQFHKFDLVTIHKLPDEFDLKLYDIVVYKYNKDISLIHRIIAIEEPNEQHPEHRHFLLKGDANEYNDKFPVLYEQMEAIYTGDRISYLGSFVLFLQSPAGWICIIFIVFMVFFIPKAEEKLQALRDKRYYLLFPEELDYIPEKKKTLIKKVIFVIFNVSKKDALEKARKANEDFYLRNEDKEK
jgi:hypothetical protein